MKVPFFAPLLNEENFTEEMFLFVKPHQFPCMAMAIKKYILTILPWYSQSYPVGGLPWQS